MSAFEIRAAGPGDVDAIAAGFARECAKPADAIAQRVRWAFTGNPAGWTGVVATRAGELVAHLGASHVPMIVSGRRALFARIFAPWVAVTYRVAGVHALIGQLDERFQDALQSASIGGAYGTFGEEDWWTLRRLFGFEPLRTELELVRPPRRHAQSPGARELVRLADASPDVLVDGIAGGACHALRDRTSVAFRTSGPYRGDTAWVVSRGGRAGGLAIVRDTPACRIALDFFCPEDDEAAALALFDAVIGDGSREIRLPWFSRSPWWLAAQRLGFRAEPKDLPFIGFRPATGRLQAGCGG